MNVINRLLNWGWWSGVVLGIFLVLLSCQFPALELWAGICGAFAFSCAVGGMGLCFIGDNNG